MGKEKVKNPSKKGKANPEKFDGLGVDFKCKLIGITEVSTNRGDDICQKAVTDLKNLALKMNKEKKEHKQRITLNITLKGIRIFDEATERIDHAHPIHRISYISHDKDDKRTFGYIASTKEGYKLFAIRTPKDAELITKTLKELFQVVFDKHQAEKNKDKENEEPESMENMPEEATPAAPSGLLDIGADVQEEIPNLLDFSDLATHGQVSSPGLEGDGFGDFDFDEVNQQIEEMQKDGLKRCSSTDFLAELADGSSFASPFADVNINVVDPSNLQPPASQAPDPFASDLLGNSVPTQVASSFDTNFNPFTQQSEPGPADSADFFSSPAPPAKPAASNGLFDLEPPPATGGKPSDDASLLISDPFAELKKNINEMHAQQQQQQAATQNQFGAQFSMGGGQQMYGQQQQQNLNPFAPTQVAPAGFGGIGPSVRAPAHGGIQAGMQPPSLPPRNDVRQTSPVMASTPAINPFMTTPVVSNDQTDMGWTVTKRPTPAPRPQEQQKPKAAGPDPFSFLDTQIGASPKSQPKQQENLFAKRSASISAKDPFGAPLMPTPAAASSGGAPASAQNDLFDLLG